MYIMTTARMDTPTTVGATPLLMTTTTTQSPVVIEGRPVVDEVALYHDEYVQLALFSLMKNLCTDMDDCQTPSTPDSVPTSPVDIADDAFHYKLEQAADLVKTHLMFAVREEVDALRGKLTDLERKIYRLEKENTLLLREYVPPEILERMDSSTTDGDSSIESLDDRFTKQRRSCDLLRQESESSESFVVGGVHQSAVPILQDNISNQQALFGSALC